MDNSRSTFTKAVLLLISALLAACNWPDNSKTQSNQQLPPGKLLNIAPIAQQTADWCWAASAQMVFQYYGLPSLNPSNFQCGIIASYFGGQCINNCSLCVYGIGPMSSMQSVINGYGNFLQSSGIGSPSLSSSLTFNALSFSQLMQEIANGRPVIVGIAPTGGAAQPNVSQHIAVIIGYDSTAISQDIVVNDPFPFAAYYTVDPYLAAGARELRPGQYEVPYTVFTQQMAWANSIYDITSN